MKKLALCVAGLLLACGAYAQGFEEQQGEFSSMLRQGKDGGATVEWYGEKAGILRPCKGNCIAVCKRITYPSSQRGEGTVQSVNAADRYVVVSDGERTIMVKASQVDWRTGAIKTK